MPRTTARGGYQDVRETFILEQIGAGQAPQHRRITFIIHE
jgi:hypothetical protein